MIGRAFFAGLSLSPAAAAAEVPSPMWHGVERVVVDCRFGPSIEPRLRDSLCRQILSETSRLTAYPVSLAIPADRAPAPGGLARQNSQLLLQISGTLEDGQEKPSSLLMSVTPLRIGIAGFRARQARSIRVPLRWSGDVAQLQQPMLPLQLLLSGPRRGGRNVPPFPVRSDGM